MKAFQKALATVVLFFAIAYTCSAGEGIMVAGVQPTPTPTPLAAEPTPEPTAGAQSTENQAGLTVAESAFFYFFQSVLPLL